MGRSSIFARAFASRAAARADIRSAICWEPGFDGVKQWGLTHSMSSKG